MKRKTSLAQVSSSSLYSGATSSEQEEDSLERRFEIQSIYKGKVKTMRTKILLTVAAAFGLLAMVSLPARQALAQDDTSAVPVTIKDLVPHPFSFSTGSPDGKLGALSRPAGSQGLETETADDFVLTQPTVISGA